MILFLAFPILALLLTMMLAAALTFAVTANLPALHNTAVTAPIGAFFLSPIVIFPVSLFVYNRFFLMQPAPDTSAYFIRVGSIEVLLLIGCVLITVLALLICHAAFEFVPRWLSIAFSLSQEALTQAAILSGGVLSICVFLAVALLSAYPLPLQPQTIVLTTSSCILGIASCLRAILRLSNAAIYRPQPLPNWVKQLLSREPTAA